MMMEPFVIGLLLANISFDTLGQIAFKYAALSHDEDSGIIQYWSRLFRRPWLWVGIGSYVFEFLLWLAFLTLVPLSQGVLLVAFNIVTIMVAGRILFKEKLTPLRITGMLLITIGVMVVGVG